jgi:hypothetical protein
MVGRSSRGGRKVRWNNNWKPLLETVGANVEVSGGDALPPSVQLPG